MAPGSETAPALDEERRAAWRELVAKTPGGEARLQTRTYDGLVLNALYGLCDGADPGRTFGLGEALRRRTPFDGDRPWDIRAPVALGNPREANAAALGELEGGAASLLFVLDPSGAAGVAVADRADAEALLEGVYLDLAPIELEAGLRGPDAAALFAEVAEARTLKPRLHLGLDPVSALARAGEAGDPNHEILRAAGRAGARLPAESAFLASGRFVHEAGGSDADEIAAALSSGLLYLKLLDAEGVPPAAGLSRITLGLAADGQYFTGLAKARAARRTWSRIAGALVPGSVPPPARVSVRASRRMLSRLDPWVNMLRLTAAAFGAAVGGADVITLDAFTEPLGDPSPLARRQARNSQLILMEEALVGAVDDPAGGAFYLERLTEDLANAAWSRFQNLEGRGGLGASAAREHLAGETAKVRDRRLEDVARRRRGLVGVSEFAALAEERPEAGERRSASSVRGSFAPFREAQAFEALRARAASMTPPPAAGVLALGPVREHADRLRFVENALAAGGVAARPLASDDPGVLQDQVVVLCGSAARYGDEAAAVLDRAFRAGARAVYLAGPREEFADPRLHGFLHRGGDLVAFLSDLLDRVEGGSK